MKVKNALSRGIELLLNHDLFRLVVLVMVFSKKLKPLIKLDQLKIKCG